MSWQQHSRLSFAIGSILPQPQHFGKHMSRKKWHCGGSALFGPCWTTEKAEKVLVTTKIPPSNVWLSTHVPMMELVERNVSRSGFCLLAELYLVQDGRWGPRELSELGFEVAFCQEQPMLSNALPGPIRHRCHQSPRTGRQWLQRRIYSSPFQTQTPLG